MCQQVQKLLRIMFKKGNETYLRYTSKTRYSKWAQLNILD